MKPTLSTAGALQLGRMLGLYGTLGVSAGLVAAAFSFLVEWSQGLLVAGLVIDAEHVLSFPTGARWFNFVVPAVGGLLSGLVCAWLAPEAMGTGTQEVVKAYHHHDGAIRTRVPGVKAVAASLTLGSGGSGGLEGPTGQIAAGIGSILGERFGLRGRERRVLTMAGFAAGIGAVFHAPMAAALFAAEVLYAEMDLEHEVLVPAIIASTVSYGVYGAVYGWHPLIALPDVGVFQGIQLVPYLLLALFLAGAAALFMFMFSVVRQRLGRNAAIPLWARPAIGGLLVGAIGVWIPSAMGTGYGILQTAADAQSAAWVLLVLAGAKAVTACLTAGSGGASGLFAPSLVVGGALGGAFGIVAAWLAPDYGIVPAAFAFVAMGAFFAAVAKAPISTVIMVSEVIGSYRLLVPALWVCTLTWLLTRRFRIIADQAPTRLDAPSQLADMMGAVLHRIPVSEALRESRRRVTVPPDLPLRELVDMFAHTRQAVFPIVKDDKLLGVVDGRQLRRTITEQGVDTLLIANDFQVPAHTVSPKETLFDAISGMTTSGHEELVVVDEATGELIGLISRRDIVTAYHRRMLDRAPNVEASGVFDMRACNLIMAIERGGVLKGIRGETPQETIGLLIAHAELPEGCDKKELLDLLLEREALGSTGVGNGVALPHPHAQELSGIDDPVVIIGLLPKPVEWGAFDGRPVDTVCILLCESGETHLTLLGELARALSDPAVKRLLEERADLSRLLEGVRKATSDTVV